MATQKFCIPTIHYICRVLTYHKPASMKADNILDLNSANDYARYLGTPVYHDHVSLVHYDEAGPVRHSLNRYQTYGIFVQRSFPANLSYGIGRYISANDSLLAVAPGQIGGIADNGERTQYYGWALLFDQAFVHNTDFERRLPQYHFFSYNVNETLRLTDDERETIDSIMSTLQRELQQYSRATDSNADAILLDYILLLCDYARRFYDRQFQTAPAEATDILSRFQRVLTEYYDQNIQKSHGLPTVKYCADKLFLSPGYLGDTLRKHLGQSPLQYIHKFIVSRAEGLLMGGKNVSEVATELGFDYPQHFTRLFKKLTGAPPSQYHGK